MLGAPFFETFGILGGKQLSGTHRFVVRSAKEVRGKKREKEGARNSEMLECGLHCCPAVASSAGEEDWPQRGGGGGCLSARKNVHIYIHIPKYS